MEEAPLSIEYFNSLLGFSLSFRLAKFYARGLIRREDANFNSLLGFSLSFAQNLEQS